MVVRTILDHFGPVHFPTVLRPLPSEGASGTLRTVTSLNKESRPLFLSDKSTWSFPSFPPFAITAFRGPEGYFSLAIKVFRAFEFFVPKYCYRLGKMEFNESSLLI